MSLQALLDATPDGQTCVIPARDHTIPEGVGLVVPHGVAAVDATGATIRVVGADGQRSTARPTVPLFDCGQWWLGPGRNTTGSIRIIGCRVELSAQTRVVGAADSSPLDVTVVASEFVGSTTRQAFNVPAGTVRFVDCEAP